MPQFCDRKAAILRQQDGNLVELALFSGITHQYDNLVREMSVLEQHEQNIQDDQPKICQR